ncbi:single-stranded DNA-binding protein [Burkholderia seminalis]|uniref:single-stranded DNA-binding protein n=1 Tax=Burkholderia seminalis TaxID=488731 RepID=UPI001452E40C|nr:single-stranded DNA-binding protein [Burkholderia seminalis]MCA8435355.1 single-stranded DNA-binding protein [Burkholderia seminalis]VWC35899.1 single-stranded DNA-binding protein [Burkholderia seminalis]
MTIDALVAGTLFKEPEERPGQSGRTFVTATVRAADGGGESLFVSVVAFSNTAKATLLALEDGDSVALTGALKIGTYEARDGSVKPNVSMVAAQVLTAYHVQRKRKAVADAGDKKQPAMAGGMDDSLDDL